VTPPNPPRFNQLPYKTQSLRRLLITRLCAFLSMLLLVGGAGVFVLVSAKLYNQFDANLRYKADALAGLAVLGTDGTPVIENNQELDSLFSHRRGEDVYEIWAGSSILSRSKSLRNDLQAPPLERSNSVWPTHLPNGRRARATVVHRVLKAPASRQHGGSGIPVTALVMSRTERIDEAVGTVALILLFVVAASVGLAAAIVAYTIRSGLQPLRTLAEQVTSVNATSLAARFEAEDASEELQPIMLRLNQLFERLDQAFQRERRFSANIAHELRTPLAELLSACEVALKWPGGREELLQALEEAHASGVTMAKAIETLLSLSRCQSGRQSPTLEPVDVDALCEVEWHKRLEELAAAELRGSWDAQTRCEMRADREMLRLVLVNLLGNAIAYTERGGEVRLQAECDGHSCTIMVSNRPHDLEPADLGLLFEPFWRKGSSRTEREHAGLGLALCRALCDVQSLELNGNIDPEGWFVMSVRGAASPAELTNSANMAFGIRS
jgi:two-component system sensor histidine kinase QseC